MTDLPPGEWSALLVGDQWPGSPSLDVLSVARLRRDDLAAALEVYADTLRTVRDSHLATQDGVTAESVRAAFGRGESEAREIAGRNRVKGAAYLRAQQCVDQLRQDLTDIARECNARIADINGSDAPQNAKVGMIVEVIATGRAAAAARTARHADGVYSAVQSVLSGQGLTGQGFTGSARTFAASHGVDTGGRPLPLDGEGLREAVGRRVNGGDTAPGPQ